MDPVIISSPKEYDTSCPVPAVVPKPTLTDGDNDNNTEDDDSRKLFSLKIADKCKVSRVRSPLSNSKVDYTPYLQKYFSKIPKSIP